MKTKKLWKFCSSVLVLALSANMGLFNTLASNTEEKVYLLSTSSNAQEHKDIEWTPIGNGSRSFKGTFDGSNCEIRGVYIDSQSNYQGLFGKAESSCIKNINISDASNASELIDSENIGNGASVHNDKLGNYNKIKVFGNRQTNTTYINRIFGR